jgi:hypothetical protein
MPQTCSVCKSKRHEEINRELVSGTSYRDIAGRYGLSKTAVARHKEAHLPASLALAKRNREALSAESLLAEMADLKDKFRSALEQAERARNPAAFVALGREFRQCLEAYFDMARAVADLTGKSTSVEPTVSLPPFEVDTVESCELIGLGGLE